MTPSPVRVSMVSVGPGAGESLTLARPVSDTERCIVAVLGATVYPGTRAFALSFDGTEGAPAPAAESEVAFYFVAAGSEVHAAPLADPARVKEAMGALQSSVAVCWEAALSRRAGLSGGRSLRLHLDEGGAVRSVQVVTNLSNSGEEAADVLLDRCLVSAASQARFPASGQPMDANYSWVFATR